MRLMTCELAPELERSPEADRDKAAALRYRHFQERSEDTWIEATSALAYEIAPEMMAIDNYDPKESDLKARELLDQHLKGAPFLVRSAIKGVIFMNRVTTTPRRRAIQERLLNQEVYRPLAHVTFKALVDGITQKALNAGDGRASMGAEELAEVATRETDPNYFRRVTGAEPDTLSQAMRVSANHLVKLPMFDNRTELMGLGSTGIILRTVELHQVD